MIWVKTITLVFRCVTSHRWCPIPYLAVFKTCGVHPVDSIRLPERFPQCMLGHNFIQWPSNSYISSNLSQRQHQDKKSLHRCNITPGSHWSLLSCLHLSVSKQYICILYPPPSTALKRRNTFLQFEYFTGSLQISSHVFNKVEATWTLFVSLLQSGCKRQPRSDWLCGSFISFTCMAKNHYITFWAWPDRRKPVWKNRQ